MRAARYTVAMRRARLDGLHAAALAAVTSLALYLPIYAYFAGTAVFKAPLSDIALQAIVQRFLTGIVALLLYGRMISILGATSDAAFLALTPADDGSRGHSHSSASCPRQSTGWRSWSSRSASTSSVLVRCQAGS
jgi:hypothetical protein